MRIDGVICVDFLDVISYIVDVVFGDGSFIGIDNFVVYDGIFSQVNISGFLFGILYWVEIYEYYGLGLNICYL